MTGVTESSKTAETEEGSVKQISSRSLSCEFYICCVYSTGSLGKSRNKQNFDHEHKLS